MTKRILVMIALLSAASAATLRADVKTTERTKIKFEGMLGRMIGLFGGNDEMSSSVAVRGSRKASLGTASGQIIDLGEEKIYNLDVKKKTYAVTTFEEIRRRMEEARKDAEKEAAKAGDKPADQPAAPEFEIDFDVKETGATKPMAGYDTRQVILTVAMRQKGKTLEQGGGLVLTSDMWLAPRIAALDEIAAFDRKYAEKLFGMATGMSADQFAALIAMHPGFQKAQERLAQEGAKLDGTSLLTTLTLESVKNPEQAAESGGGGGIGGMAGRLMRRNRDKPGERNKVFTSTHETLSIATAVSDADLAIPADFREK